MAVNDQETLKTVLTVISMILKDPKSDPILQLQAVRVNNIFLLNSFQKM